MRSSTYGPLSGPITHSSLASHGLVRPWSAPLPLPRKRCMVGRFVAGLAAGLVFGFAVGAGVTAEAAPRESLPGAPVFPSVPCLTEDSAGPCFWDAWSRGNGLGRSFVVSSDQRVIYAD